MSTLNSLLLDRRLWLAGLTTVLGLVLGLWTFSPSAALKLVSHLGYWVVLGVFVMFVWAVQRVVGRVFADWRPSSYRLRVAAFIGIAGCILLAHEKYGFKILADEALLLGTSMGIHHVREVAYPLRATDVQGPFQILDRRVDKRPFFYPFLVSLVHDFTGYRTTNGFYLNTVLGFLFLGLVYALARRVSGMEWGGVFAVLLFAGLPLLSQQMKGGGFELLNLVMLTTTALLSIHFAEKRDEIALNALVMSAVLLGLTRYESILVLVPVALLIVWGWWIERRVVLTWPAIFSPLILSVYLLQNRIFTVQESSWELASRPEATTPFGLHYLGDNLAHAVAFFFDTSGYQPNSPFFAAIGLCALPFLVLWLTRLLLRLRNAEPEQVGIALSAVGLIGIAGLLMVYFWGQFDHPVIHRLSLPVHLLMVLAIAVTGRQLFRRSRGWQVLCGGAILALVAYSLPAMSRRAYAHSYSPAVAMEWRAEFLERYPDRDYLFIDNDSFFWIAHEVAATPTKQARLRKEGLVFHLRNHSFSAMYVFQRYNVDPETGALHVDPADDLGEDFGLETVWERRIQTLHLGRISRITEIREGDETTKASRFVPAAAGRMRSEGELEKAKEEFVKRWVRELP